MKRELVLFDTCTTNKCWTSFSINKIYEYKRWYLDPHLTAQYPNKFLIWLRPTSIKIHVHNMRTCVLKQNFRSAASTLKIWLDIGLHTKWWHIMPVRKGGGRRPPPFGVCFCLCFLLACLFRGWWCTKIPLRGPVSGKLTHIFFEKGSHPPPPPPPPGWRRTNKNRDGPGAKIRTPVFKKLLMGWEGH